MYKVLFVCTGNICRSPSAEAVFRHMVEEAGLEARIEIDSAGTHGYHIGAAPDPRSVATAKTRGISMAGLSARKVEASDFEEFDLILTMDQGHYDDLNARGAGGNVQMFLDYAEGCEFNDVPDPYYGRQDGFDLVFDLVEQGCRGLLKKLQQKTL